jgi:hypothetical protein
MRKPIVRLLVVLGIVIVGLQFVPVQRTNPPVAADLQADPAVKAALRGSCYNCHSNETHWPWYARVAPVAWLVAHDVAEARSRIDFSDWGNYDAARQERRAAGCAEEAEQRGMPPMLYLIMHPDARLTIEKTRALRMWADSLASARTQPSH